MTDPAEIDLEALGEPCIGNERKLIAEVKALRERIVTDGLPCACRFRGVEGAIRHGSDTGELVDPDDPIRECALHKALRERATHDTTQIKQLIAANEHWHTRVTTLKADAEAAEAVNNSIRVCRDHTLEVTGEGCLVCDLAAAEARVAELNHWRDRAVEHADHALATDIHVAELAGVLDWLVEHGDAIAADLKSAHLVRIDAASEWMRDEDRELLRGLRSAILKAVAILATMPAEALERVGAIRGYLKRIIEAIARTTSSGQIRREHDEVTRLAGQALADLGALASTPAGASERARARDAVMTAARQDRVGARNEIISVAERGGPAWNWFLGIDNALAALAKLGVFASTPAAAQERARAKDAVITTAKAYLLGCDSHDELSVALDELSAALAKLDALDQEDGT